MIDHALDVAKKAARAAGGKIIEIYKGEYEVDYKDDASPLTCADREADQIIIKMIHDSFPDHAILSEESTDDLSRLSAEFCWIVDPLDGTKEFIHATDEFTVNIALSKNHEILLGVVYVPVTGEMYYAGRGMGSYYEVDNTIGKIHVSDRTERLRLLSSKYHKSDAFLDLVEDNASRISMVEGVGSSLKGCLIARGLAECYYRYGLTSEWDTAAVQIVVEEAGGLFRQLDHTDMVYNRVDTLNRKGFYIVNKAENILNQVL